MTVAELIHELKKLDPKLVVVAYGQLGDDGGKSEGVAPEEIADLAWHRIVNYHIATLNDGGNDVRAVLLGTK